MTTARLEVNHGMARKYQRPSRFVPVLNPMVKGFLHLGAPMGPMALLTVRGRKSGQRRTTPVAVIKLEGNRYIVSVYGMSQWVQNLRAYPEARLKQGWSWQNVKIDELSSGDAAPVLEHAYKISPGFLKKYFNATPTSTVEDFERDAANHPVFKVIGSGE